MRNLSDYLESHRKLILWLFFAGLLIIGLAVFRDYGISWDENVQRRYGEMVYSYIAKGEEDIFSDRHRHYGPAFQLLLRSIEEAAGIEDSRNVYLMNHLMTFLLFYVGVVFFYLLCKYLFRSWKIGLLGTLFLVLSPRIFAHGFYNPKDIPFMAVFAVGMFTLTKYLDTKTIGAALVHAAICGIATDLRIVGAMLPALTLLSVFLLSLRYRSRKSEVRRLWVSTGVFIPVLIGVTVLLWPTLWRSPFQRFIEALGEMRRFPWEGTVRYLGADLPSGSLPWHYGPVWIAITTPVSYVVFSAVGIAVTVRSLLIEKATSPIKSRRDRLLVLVWFLFPPAYLIASRAVVYDAWRHMFFVYPAFLVLALSGLLWVYRLLRSRLAGRTGAAALAVLALAITFDVGVVATFMIRYHPYQNLYFNGFVGGIRGACHRFELDYWGLSYREALEYILRVDDRKRIKIYVSQEVGRDAVEILKPEDRGQLVFVDESVNSNYHITTFRWQDQKKASSDTFHSIEVDGVPIIVIYRIRLL
jgi:hypothetical protein